MDYNISNEELSKLVSNYSITEIIDGKVKGKGSSKIRVLQNRKRAIEEKIKQGNFSPLGLAYVNYKIEQKKKTRYWQNKFADENSLFKKQDVDSLDKFIEATVNNYIALANAKDEKIISITSAPNLYQKIAKIFSFAPNIKSEAAGSTKKVLGTIAIAGLLFTGGYLLGKHSNLKQPTAQVSGLYSPISNVYAAEPSQEVKTKSIIIEPVQDKSSLEKKVLAENPNIQSTGNKGIFVKGYTNHPEISFDKQKLERKIELARLNHDDFAVSKYQTQLKNLDSQAKEPKKEISKDKSKTKNWFIKDIDNWAKDILSPLRFDRLFKGKEGIKEYREKFLILGRKSYHRQHPIKSLTYDLSAYSIIEAAEALAGDEAGISLIGEGDGGLGEI